MSLSLSLNQATSHSSAMLTSEGAHTMDQDDVHRGPKMASTATTAAASSSSDGAETMTDTDVDMEMEMEEADMTRWTEAEFEEKCTYIVKDTAWEAGPDGDTMMMTTTRAEASLPRNLAFKHPAESKEVRLNTHSGRHTNFLSSHNFSHTFRHRKPSVHTHTHVSQMPVM